MVAPQAGKTSWVAAARAMAGRAEPLAANSRASAAPRPNAIGSRQEPIRVCQWRTEESANDQPGGREFRLLVTCSDRKADEVKIMSG